MDAPVAASRFLHLLGNSRLLSPKQMAEIVGRHGLDKRLADEEAAQELVNAGVLTRYQADRLLAGRSRGFLYGPYRVLDAVGAGGMSRILLAEETQTRQRVALKTLVKGHEHEADLVARLKLEARVGEMIRHPHLLQGRQLGEAGGSYYLVMEYVEGIELQELIDSCGPPAVGQACDFIRQAAEGLHAAHQVGIVHRDVKPQNLLIDRSGHVKLLDFGLAHLGAGSADDEFSLAMIYGHNCLGTAYFISPEQSLDSDRVDARADIYSLGCTLYHALTGEYPFKAEGSSTSEVISRILRAARTEPPRPIQEFGHSIPEALVSIVERMMAKRPEDRFPTAAEVAEALAPFAHRRPIDADVESILSRRTSRARRLLIDSETGSRTSGSSGRSLRRTPRLGSSHGRSRSRTESAILHGDFVQTVLSGLADSPVAPGLDLAD